MTRLTTYFVNAGAADNGTAYCARDEYDMCYPFDCAAQGAKCSDDCVPLGLCVQAALAALLLLLLLLLSPRFQVNVTLAPNLSSPPTGVGRASGRGRIGRSTRVRGVAPAVPRERERERGWGRRRTGCAQGQEAEGEDGGGGARKGGGTGSPLLQAWHPLRGHGRGHDFRRRGWRERLWHEGHRRQRLGAIRMDH